MNEGVSTMRPITGRFVLIAIVAFFAVVMGVNVVMIRLAIETLPGTDVDSAYSASLAYQGEIDAARDQDSRGWRVDAHVERTRDGRATLNVETRDRNGAPLTGLAFSGRLERPTDRRADLPMLLTEQGGGRYSGDAAGVAPGQWELVIEGETAGRRIFLSRNRIILN